MSLNTIAQIVQDHGFDYEIIREENIVWVHDGNERKAFKAGTSLKELKEWLGY